MNRAVAAVASAVAVALGIVAVRLSGWADQTKASQGRASTPSAQSTSAPDQISGTRMLRAKEKEISRAGRALVSETVFQIPVADQDPAQGPADAPVTIVMFGDFDCPWSQRGAATVDGIVKAHPDVRLVWKHNPMAFHENALPAATLALEAFAQGGAAKFWEAHDLLFRSQDRLSREQLALHGKRLGLDLKKLRKALELDAYKAKLDEDVELARRMDVVITTPMFAINGRYLKGAQSRAVFELLIEEELRKANVRLAQGTPKHLLYEEIVAEGEIAPLASNAQATAAPGSPQR